MSDLDDPEDAYDADDDIAERLTNFVRRVGWIVDHLPGPLDPDVVGHLHRLADDLATLRVEVGEP